MKHDKQGIFKFASIQGQTGQALLTQAGLSTYDLQTLLLVEEPSEVRRIRPVRHWQNTAAIFLILHALGWPWRLAWAGYAVPSPLRDAAYRVIARNRYRLFGKSETCLLPTPSDVGRFLA